MDLFTPEDIKKIAARAALEIAEEDLADIAARFDRILSRTPPPEILSPEEESEEPVSLREDRTGEGLSPSAVFAASAVHGEDFFLLPRVVEESK